MRPHMSIHRCPVPLERIAAGTEDPPFVIPVVKESLVLTGKTQRKYEQSEILCTKQRTYVMSIGNESAAVSTLIPMMQASLPRETVTGAGLVVVSGLLREGFSSLN